MNHQNSIKYRLYKTSVTEYHARIEDLLRQVDVSNILRLVFFAKVDSGYSYAKKDRYLLRLHLQNYPELNKLPVSFIAQAPLDAEMILEVHYCDLGPSDVLQYKEKSSNVYALLENQFGRFLFVSGLSSDPGNQNIKQQSESVFNQLDEILTAEQFPINSIVRQWNYITNITEIHRHTHHQTYQTFSDVRTEYYNKVEWPNGYPAATGIGTSHGGILIEVDAAITTQQNIALDNKMQIAAHAYSDNVLISEGKQNTTPKFERGRCLQSEQGSFIYISGTAAIRGELSLTEAYLAKQTAITMENILFLVSQSNLQSAGVTCSQRPKISILRVYLKNIELLQEAVKIMETYSPVVDTNAIAYVLADICRPELLIEIEGTAVSG